MLSWISDISRWAQTIASLMKDDEVFYIMEAHPSYFGSPDPLHLKDDHPDYSDKDHVPVNRTGMVQTEEGWWEFEKYQSVEAPIAAAA